MDTQMNNQMNVDAEETVNAPTLYSKKIVEFGKNNILYLAYMISMSLVALGFFLAFLFNIVLGGSGVAVSTMISSTFGHIIRALIYVPILVAVGFGTYSGWRLYAKKDDKFLEDTKALAFFPSIMAYFSIFSLIDAMFIAFLCIVKAGYPILETILNFMGYESIDIFLSMIDPAAESAGFFEVVVSVFFGLLFVAYRLAMILLYNKIKNHYHSITNYAVRGNYEIESKPPYIFLFVIAGINVVFSVFAFVAGNWITGIMDIALAGYFTSSALLFRTTHTYLSNK